ncbi:MAG: hypothetical protein ACFB00_05160 [Parvularculaceae bacterium]
MTDREALIFLAMAALFVAGLVLRTLYEDRRKRERRGDPGAP